VQNFQILIVSAVGICTQCLQTAEPLNPTGGRSPADPLSCSPPKWIFLESPLVFSHICLHVYAHLSFLCSNYESLDLETSFLACTYIIRISRSGSLGQGQGQGHRNKGHTSDLTLAEMHSCWLFICAVFMYV